MIIVLDTETTGVDSTKDRLVSVAWVCYSNEGRFMRSESHVIHQEGKLIPEKSIAIHGITDLVAETIGEALIDVMEKLIDDIANADLIVGHHVRFDIRFVKEGFRAAKFYPNVIAQVDDIPIACTCETPKHWFGKYKENKNGTRVLKRPRLQELHFRLFGKDFVGEHTALQDALACAKCYFKLTEMGVIPSHFVNAAI